LFSLERECERETDEEKATEREREREKERETHTERKGERATERETKREREPHTNSLVQEDNCTLLLLCFALLSYHSLAFKFALLRAVLLLHAHARVVCELSLQQIATHYNTLQHATTR